MDPGVKGRTALVLGAGGGLGRAISVTLAVEGAQVAAADLVEDGVVQTAAAVERSGARALALTWDLADLGVIDAQVGRIEAELGPVDILVAITGGPPPGSASGQPAQMWRQHIDSMVVSVITIADRVISEHARPEMGADRHLHLVGVLAPIPNLGLSNALHLSLVGWSKTLATELAGDGITCNVVIPGRIATGRITFLDEKKAERENRSVHAVRADSLSAIPMGRYGDPQEYADAVAFLASERASYSTGSQIRVDGGYIPSI